VREGLTNVARHARAAQCTVTLTATSVEIRDNGIGQPNHVRSTSAETQENDAGGDAGSRATLAAAGSRSSMVGDGTGLNGLRERIAAAGGRLEAGPLTPHGWRLRATLGGRG
jgi:two-component system sensor histidine kinase DesK